MNSWLVLPGVCFSKAPETFGPIKPFLVYLSLNPFTPKGSPFDKYLKSSGIRQSKIYKSLLGSKGLRGIVF